MQRRLLALPTGLLLALLSFTACAENVDVLMNKLFPNGDLTYIGFDSIEREDIPAASGADRKYLIVDFRSSNPQDQQQQLASVHQICTTLLRSRDLIRDLSQQGYDMVSVAFDRYSQYDCL